MSKITWLKLYANPEKGGNGIECFALAISFRWNGKHSAIDSVQTKVFSYRSEGDVHFEKLHPHKHQFWDFEECDNVPDWVKIDLLTHAVLY